MLPVRIGAFHEVFDLIAQGGTIDLLARACGRNGAAQLANDLVRIVNLRAGGSAAGKSMLAKASE
jgi:hypothetical protein